MTQGPGRILIIGGSTEDQASWRELLSSGGWQVESAAPEGPPPDLATFDVTVIAAGTAESLSGFLVDHPEVDTGSLLPVLRDASAETVVELVRSGVNDILLRPFGNQEFLDSIERVALYRDLYRENRTYRRRLEKKNKELRESLNILRMDQIAGRQVQKNLMPRSKLEHEGYTVSYKIIPSLYLSGDFVAYNLVFDRFILFYIADVSGHGASSAFVTILLRFILKRIIRKHLRENDIEALSQAPQGFVEHVNRQLLATGLEKQLTMFAGTIDTSKNQLRYSVAAQVPMPVLVTGGEARFLEGKGKVVGLFEDVHWHVNQLDLPDEFELVMVSDGLLETLPGDGLAGREDYLLKTLAEARPRHEDICNALGLNEVSEAKDDVSILTIFHKSTG